MTAAALMKVIPRLRQHTLVVLMICFPFSALHSYQRSDPGQRIVLDGTKNPEMFPEWFLWRGIFRRVVHEASRSGLITPDERIGLSAEDWAIVVVEAKQQSAREAKQFTQFEPMVAELKRRKLTAREMFEALEPYELEDRRAFLAGRDRMYDRLSTQGIQVLRSWGTDNVLRGTHMNMAKSEYERFRKPM